MRLIDSVKIQHPSSPVCRPPHRSCVVPQEEQIKGTTCRYLHSLPHTLDCLALYPGAHCKYIIVMIGE